MCFALHGNLPLELQSATCYMDYSVTCHATQENVFHLNPSQTVLDLPTTERWKAELTLVVDYIPRWFTCLQTVTHLSSIQAGVEPMTS